MGSDGPATDLSQIEVSVEGVSREGLIHVPKEARTKPTAVVFVFHGHGGSAQSAAKSFGLEHYWPEAIVVYLQGLKTPGQLTDPAGNLAGWQAHAGDQNDCDLKLFDTVLAHLKQEYHVDENRICATGHSNGGGFTYLLWKQRGDVLAAVAPSAAAASYARTLKPKPALLIAGQNDHLVKFSWQKATMDAVREINNCDPAGQSWDKGATIYPSKSGNPLVTVIHPGGHELDHAAPELIARFFKENLKH